MKRIKDLICESDVVERNPLKPTYNQSFPPRDGVVVTDAEDDLDTLDGRINARGRAEPLRTRYVDAARRVQNRTDLYEEYLPILEELERKLEMEGFARVSTLVRTLIFELANEVLPEDDALDSVKYNARRPIYVGDNILRDPGYYGHKKAWT
jgi:hypothetical protein